MKAPSIDQRLQDLADHLSQDQTLLKNYEDFLRYEDDPKQQGCSASHKPIWQVAREIRQNLSEEDLRQLPTDGAVNHDHYIYGTPKVEP